MEVERDGGRKRWREREMKVAEQRIRARVSADKHTSSYTHIHV